MKPTVGRVVLFNPKPGAVPVVKHAALITYVHSDTLVNLAAFDCMGLAYARTSVELVAPGAPCPEFGAYCQWMPLQVQHSDGESQRVSFSVDRKTADALQRIIQKIDEKIQEEMA